MTAAVETRAARKKSVTVRNLADIFIRAARRDNRPRATFFPNVNVFLRLKGDDSFARRAGSRLDSNAIF